MANYRRAARRAARRHGLDPNIFVRQIQQESGFNPNARSPAGARGIAQIMPATARGWGVNPDDPIAALNAAAKNMASYVRKYGGYENALRAYNAGPGAIQASKGYAETNNYVKTILRGSDPGKLGAPSAPTGGGGGTRQGVPSSQINVAELLSMLSGAERAEPAPPDPASLVDTASVPQAALPQGGLSQTLAELRPQQQRPDYAGALAKLAEIGQQRQAEILQTADKVVRSTPGAGGGNLPGELKELIWRGAGAQTVKDGTPVPASSFTGHTDHVHVAGRQRAMITLGKLAQREGLTVRENPAFDPVDPVHVAGSYHYGKRVGKKRFRAIDVSGDPALMRKFARQVRRAYRI